MSTKQYMRFSMFELQSARGREAAGRERKARSERLEVQQSSERAGRERSGWGTLAAAAALTFPQRIQHPLAVSPAVILFRKSRRII